MDLSMSSRPRVPGKASSHKLVQASAHVGVLLQGEFEVS